MDAGEELAALPEPQALTDQLTHCAARLSALTTAVQVHDKELQALEARAARLQGEVKALHTVGGVFTLFVAVPANACHTNACHARNSTLVRNAPPCPQNKKSQAPEQQRLQAAVSAKEARVEGVQQQIDAINDSVFRSFCKKVALRNVVVVMRASQRIVCTDEGEKRGGVSRGHAGQDAAAGQAAYHLRQPCMLP